MIKSAVYFIRFSCKHNPAYLCYNLLYQLIKAVNLLFNMYLPKIILDELFVKHCNRNAYIAGIVLVIGVLIFNSISNVLAYGIANKKEELEKSFRCYMYENLATCDFEHIESPDFHNLKEKAKNYIGGQWGEFGKILDIVFQMIGNIFVLASLLYLFTYLNFAVVICFIILFSFNNYISSYYKKKSLQLQMNEMPQVIRRKSYYDNLTKDIKIGQEIRVFHLTEWILSQYNKYMEKFTDTTSKIYKYNQNVKLWIAVSDTIKLIVTYGYLVYAVIAKDISVGVFTMLLSAITHFNNTMNQIITEAMDLSRYRAYYQAFLRYVNPTKNMLWGEKTVESNTQYKIEFCNVSFKYPGQEEYVIRNFSTTILPNTKVSLVGKNGAGKSTIIKLLMGLYGTYEGEIKLNGINIKEYNEEQYRNIFATIFQDYNLYAFSLRENITMSYSEKVTDDQILRAMEAVRFDKKVTSLRNGLDTQIFKLFDQSGIELSGGEGQKVGIIRAMMKNSPVFILDEPTAALDPKAEYEIYRSFDQIVKNKTVVYISHRLASTKLCNKIIVMDHGSVIEEGTHEELLCKKGVYATMYMTQSQLYQKG